MPQSPRLPACLGSQKTAGFPEPPNSRQLLTGMPASPAESKCAAGVGRSFSYDPSLPLANQD
ncbi:MAG: hypothetical protein MUC60_15180 [Oscillatoria sp. Prado101]|nr:hypothetical protein [Oscillatoria sp. Prado101]